MMNNMINQNGRSMIEMLGVLAIVGVLSVGGIAGYSKAMQKYRTNKTIEQVTQIINGVRTLYSHQKNYQGITARYNGPIRKAKILPESAWESTGQYALPKNPFGGDYWLDTFGNSSQTFDNVVLLSLFKIPDDACIELATQDWGAGEGLYSVAVKTITDRSEGCPGWYPRSGFVQGCAGGSTVPLPIPVDLAMEACQQGNNDLFFLFY